MTTLCFSSSFCTCVLAPSSPSAFHYIHTHWQYAYILYYIAFQTAPLLSSSWGWPWCSLTLLTPMVPLPQPTASSSCRGRGRGSPHSYRGTRQDYPLTLYPSETSYRDLCVVLMWDPLHQYWTTNSILLEDVDMGGWPGGSEGGWVREGVGVG